MEEDMETTLPNQHTIHIHTPSAADGLDHDSDSDIIQLDSPPTTGADPDARKRRRMHSPDPTTASEIIDAPLARKLWEGTYHTLEPHSQKRRRHSDQSLVSDSSPNNTSSTTTLPPPPTAPARKPANKKLREKSPQPDAGTKRSQHPDDDDDSSPLSSDHDHQPQQKRPKRQPSPPNTRSKTKAARSLPKHNIQPTPSSSLPSPNFVLPSATRTEYAVKVEWANKRREEGNVHYQNKQYHLAIVCYTEAINAYPAEPFPGQPRHPGYSASFANIASAFMALGGYETAAANLEASIKAIHLPPLLPQDTRATLIKRVFRLVRCYVALLDGPKAARALAILTRNGLDIQIPPGDANYAEWATLFKRANFLDELKMEMDLARSTQRWRAALDCVWKLQREILAWGFKLSSAGLPGLWSLWEAEICSRTGKPVEADRILSSFLPSAATKCEYMFNEGLVALARADLLRAGSKFTQVLTVYPTYEPALRMQGLVASSTSSMDAIDACISRKARVEAIAACDKFLSELKDLILATLRIRVETIRCEQLSKECLRDVAVGREFCTRVVSSSIALLSRIGFTSRSMVSKRVFYEPYREYLVRTLLAQARAMHAYPAHYQAQPLYLTLFDLLRSWPNLVLPSVLEEIRSRMEDKSSRPSSGAGAGSSYSDWFHQDPGAQYWQRRNSYFHGSHSHFHDSYSSRNSHSRQSNHAGRASNSSDPKGYYRALGLQKGATGAEIKKAFRALSLKHHPDKGGKTELFQSINQAHSVLSNADLRTKYDLTGR
ncbi:hypothetical protein PCANC_09014 [Puccinia coronata f. sp. avenae]|uniref:J domain-containing protein n=1 Tax=Puccinia coronata f. sp. avenae TaxID=200324 RepID=A0A2N5VHT7_9BASI|nr:hypothetical protein PCANC_09014 [Puccinia coronata f. sp. avenae]